MEQQSEPNVIEPPDNVSEPPGIIVPPADTSVLIKNTTPQLPKNLYFIVFIIVGVLFASLQYLKPQFDIRGKAATLTATPTPSGYLAVSRVIAPITGTLVNPILNSVLSTPGQWDAFYDSLKKIGIDTVIITQTGAVTCQSGTSSYDGTIQTDDKNAVKTALESGLNTYIGTLMPNPDCLKPFSDESQRNTYLAFHQKNINSLRRYLDTVNLSGKPNFLGFYIPAESHIASMGSSNVIELNKAFGSQIKVMYPGKKVLISPYFGNPDITADSVAQNMQDFLTAVPNIDIVAPQDMGAGRESGNIITHEKSRELYSRLANVFLNARGKVLWANIEPEIYKQDTGFVPKESVSEVSAQIDAVKPYVAKIMMWIYQLSMMPADVAVLPGNLSYNEEHALKRQQLRFDYISTYSIDKHDGYSIIPDSNFQNDTVRSIKVYTKLAEGSIFKAEIYYLSRTDTGDKIRHLMLDRPLVSFENATEGQKVIRVPISLLPGYKTGSTVAMGLFR